MPKELPPVSELHKLLLCDPESGNLWWRHRGDEYFSSTGRAAYWNSRFARTRALNSRGKHGYRIGKLLGENASAHRVVWAMCLGNWPNGHIDHINGDRMDNRIDNLRIVDPATNARNSRLSSANKSGVCGVGKRGKTPRWFAQIRFEGKSNYLGTFGCKTAAHFARLKAEAKYGFHKNHGVKIKDDTTSQ